jgi:hypothetical protein
MCGVECWGVVVVMLERMVDPVPFTLMLSPRWASVRISSQLVMVNEVPPPPLAEVSRGSSEETAGKLR